jgi:DNA-binding beta-propeller fold protein YncE
LRRRTNKLLSVTNNHRSRIANRTCRNIDLHFLIVEDTVKLAKILCLSAAIFLILAHGVAEPKPATLKLVHTTPLPQLHDGDFDHFCADLAGHRLFAAAEENSKVLVFDLNTNKLVHTIEDLKAPHSMLYRPDSKKLYIVDGDLGEVRIYETQGYKTVRSVKLREGADASIYDPQTQRLYVVNGGKDAKMPSAYINIVDTSSDKVVGEIKLDSDDVEGMVLEHSGPRIFVVIRGNNAIEAFDRNNNTLVGTWSIAKEGKKPTAIAYDAQNDRLLVGSRDPGKLIVLNTDSGAVVTSYPAPGMVDDMAFDSRRNQVYFAGTNYLDVFQQSDADHYVRVEHIPTAFRAKTGILIPELNKYYLGVPHHQHRSAELRVYSITP